MKIAILSDVHANLEALRAVLADAASQGADEILSLGDVVGYGPDPEACLELVRRRAAASVLGNHDAAVVGATPPGQFNELARQALEWTATVLGEEGRRYLGSLPYEARRRGLLLVHGSPHQPRRWHYLFAAADAGPEFAHFEESWCAVGHTHVPFVAVRDPDGGVREVSGSPVRVGAGCRCLLNAGSVGQPRDRDPRAAYAMLDTRAGEVAIRRVSYAVERTQRAMRRAGLPAFLIDRLARGI